MKNLINDFVEDETGAMTIEAAIITAILVALAIAFRKQITKLWQAMKDKMIDMEGKIRNS